MKIYEKYLPGFLNRGVSLHSTHTRNVHDNQWRSVDHAEMHVFFIFFILYIMVIALVLFYARIIIFEQIIEK